MVIGPDGLILKSFTNILIKCSLDFINYYPGKGLIIEIQINFCLPFIPGSGYNYRFAGYSAGMDSICKSRSILSVVINLIHQSLTHRTDKPWFLMKRLF